MIVAIDGPAASGKSTVAKALAARLRFQYLDTGAMYRAIAWRALEDGVALADEDALTRLAASARVTFEPVAGADTGSAPATGGHVERVLIDGDDVTAAIRKPAVDDVVSAVASVPGVRVAMVAAQRRLAESGSYVVEGRDIGTTVFPDADVKVFVTASPEERARGGGAPRATGPPGLRPHDVSPREGDGSHRGRHHGTLRGRGRRPHRGARDGVSGVFYRFMRFFVLYLPLRLAFRVRYVHAERMPKYGPAVLAASHSSYLDPVLLGLVRAAPIHYMGKSELFEGNRLLAWFLRAVCVFPVRRGTADRHAVVEATELLQQGEFVGIFPEGTRGSGELGDAMRGAAFIAMRAGAPVVPACLDGTDRILLKGARFPRFPKVTIAFGHPVLPAEFTEGGRRERVDALTAVMMERVREACAEAGRGA